MKKLVLLSAFAFALFLMSCHEDNTQLTDDQLAEQIMQATDKEITDISDLPATLQTQLGEEFFETYIEEAYFVRGKGYGVRLGTEDRIFCDTRGRILRPHRRHLSDGPCGRGESIRPNALPSNITDYINENYPGAQAMRAKQLASGTYFVKIDQPEYILVFEADGSFLEATVLFFHCRPLGLPLNVTDLPASVSNYVAENFDGAQIIVAFHKSNGMYIIGISTAAGRAILGFDEEGNLLFSRN